jgi:hypothetical protein
MLRERSEIFFNARASHSPARRPSTLPAGTRTCQNQSVGTGLALNAVHPANPSLGEFMITVVASFCSARLRRLPSPPSAEMLSRKTNSSGSSPVNMECRITAAKGRILEGRAAKSRTSGGIGRKRRRRVFAQGIAVCRNLLLPEPLPNANGQSTRLSISTVPSARFVAPSAVTSATVLSGRY